MNILLIHGEDTHKSRNAYYSKRKSYPASTQHISLDGKKLDLNQFIQATQSQSLLTDRKLVTVEDLARNRSTNTKKAIFKELKDISAENLDIDIIFWESKQLSAAAAKKYQPTKVEHFKIDTKLFTWLDQFKPGNHQRLNALLVELLDSQAEELLLFMLGRHVAELIQASAGNLKGPSWKIQKLKRQSQSFSHQELTQLADKILDIDYKNKSGTLPVPLKTQLSVLCMTL